MLMRRSWLLIGTSPSVLRSLPIVRGEFDATITSNAGIELEPVPSVYLCVDSEASVKYEAAAHHAQKNGTVLATKRRAAAAQAAVRTDFYDEKHDFVDGKFDGTGLTKFGFSGPRSLQYAVLNGAETVVLVGCDGYAGKDDYFNGQNSHSQRHRPEDRTENVLAAGFRDVAKHCPQVRFVQYGKPLFAVDYQNWEVREC